MLHWSSVRLETIEEPAFSDSITMASFCSTERSRTRSLISWPRVQNQFMPDPRYIELPDPSVYSQLRAGKVEYFKAFYFDLANMFHNIRLPNFLLRLFPLRSISFGNLPGNLQRKIIGLLGHRPKQSAHYRPHSRWDLSGQCISRTLLHPRSL